MILKSGIWWIFDLITTAVGHKDYGGTCTVQIVLDLPNLLAVSLQFFHCLRKKYISCFSQGVLICLATVGKRSVMKGLKETTGLSSLSRSRAKTSSETSSSNNTKDTQLASTVV